MVILLSVIFIFSSGKALLTISPAITSPLDIILQRSIYRRVDVLKLVISHEQFISLILFNSRKSVCHEAPGTQPSKFEQNIFPQSYIANLPMREADGSSNVQVTGAILSIPSRCHHVGCHDDDQKLHLNSDKSLTDINDQVKTHSYTELLFERDTQKLKTPPVLSQDKNIIFQLMSHISLAFLSIIYLKSAPVMFSV